nr:retrovirus-related Pol polyprotein from transposon TNT 1-94 [Tanacetum cinerariifolium]
MGNNIPRLKEVKDYLGNCFSMKDLGEAAYILGIKIYRDRSRRLIGLSQSTYVDKILKKYNMHNSKKGKPDTKLDVTGFCNASWQCDKDDTKSQTDYVCVVNGGALDWKSKKRTTNAMHSAQAEYVATSEAAMEAVWIKKFVGDLGVIPSINKPINMYCDNSAAIIFANEHGIMKGARHFLRRYH